MTKLNLFQRLFTQEVIGDIVDRRYAHEGVFRKPVTLYTIMQEDGTFCRGMLFGHNTSPNIGERVEMYLEKGNPILEREEAGWKKIRGYRIL